MKSGHPEEPAPQGELLVLVSGTSIELKALLARLQGAGVRTLGLEEAGADGAAPLPRLVLCDLASDGVLPQLQRYYATGAEPGPLLVTLGSPRGTPSEAEATLLASAVESYRRPLDVQAIAERVSTLLKQARPSRSPASHREVSLAPLKPRASQLPRLSAAPRADGPPPSSSARPSAPTPEELAPVPSRQPGPSGAEHSVVSPELETLLAEAERRVQAQISMQGEAVGSSPPESATALLSDDVWDALGEALEDDADSPAGDPLSDPMPPSPLALEAEPGSVAPVARAPGDSTVPPAHWAEPVNEDTGPFAAIPESEPTSGSLHPVTSASKGPATLAPGARSALEDTRGTAASEDSLHEPLPSLRELDGDDDEGTASGNPRPTRPPSTTALGGRRRTTEARPATVPARLPVPSPSELPASERTGPLRDAQRVVREERPAAREMERLMRDVVPPREAARSAREPLAARREPTRPPREHEPPRPHEPPSRALEPARELEPLLRDPPARPAPVERAPDSERNDTRAGQTSAGLDDVAAPVLELPGALVRGGAPLVIARAVRQRFSGCLAFEVDQGLRRVVFKEGDVVIAASAVHGESLVAFLAQRGDLSPETAAQIEHRIPTFGRHAGAALIARGLLEQGELWPVLRSHSEWVLAQLFSIERGTVHIEHPIPERLEAEPAVFGGATGAEVLVEVVERAVPPSQALDHLGDGSATFQPGTAIKLLGECALARELNELVARAQQLPLEQLLAESKEPRLPCVLYSLTLLEVLRRVELAPAAEGPAPRLRAAPARDEIDDDAVRARVLARRALVDEGDYFALLGVPRQATGYDIRRSYVELRRQFDPGLILRKSTLDLAEDVDTILEVLDEAYEILRDQQRRERYRRAIESTP